MIGKPNEPRSGGAFSFAYLVYDKEDMEKIAFSELPEFRVETYTKENLAYPESRKLEPFRVYSDHETRSLLSADEIPFFFFDRKTHSYGGAALSIEDVKNEIVLKKFKPIMVQYAFAPSDMVVYLGPSLTFSHILVERDFIVNLLNHGYRAATKRTDGIDFFDARMMAVVMLRKLGIPFDNIYLDNHDTFECEDLLYSKLRGEEGKNPSYITVA